MNNRRMILSFCMSLLLLTCSMLTACSDKAKNILSGEAGAGKGPDVKIEKPETKEDSSICEMGEEIEVTYMDVNGIEQTELKYCLNRVKLYENPEAAGLTSEQRVQAEYYWLSPHEPEILEVSEQMGYQTILCDLTIENSAASVLNIAGFTIAYENSQKELEKIGNPIYFSDHGEATKYYDFSLLPGEKKEYQVAWAYDEQLWGQYDLFFCWNFSGDSRQLIPIDVHVEE